MKQLKPTPLKPNYYADTEKEIKAFFDRVIFAPLFAELKKSNIEIKNTNSPLYDALQTGRVYYDAGYIKGKFSSKISADLRKHGAKYDASKSGWHLPISKASPDIKIAMQLAETQLVDLQNRLVTTLDGIDVNAALEQYEFNFDMPAEKANTDINKALKGITIPVEFTDEQKQALRDQWQENLKLYVKEWSEDNIIKMRKDITQNVVAGRRASQMEKVIAKEYGVSQNKARFLARQETSLMLSKMKETRYGNAGIFKYKWSTSKDSRVRDRHRHLDGGIFSFDDPPIVDLETGRTANAGEDFNCRCVAIPIIE